MEDFPEELRTPPVSLVSLVGCPELHPAISGFLHSENAPINTLALPDFSKISILARKQPKDPLAAPQPAGGFLKRGWLLKHRTRVPAVAAALFWAYHISGGPAQWLQVCTDLENLKALVRGRNTKLIIVIVQEDINDEISEDLMIALRKRAEIESKYLITFVQNDASELRQSFNRLAGIFAELCNSYYREEGRRIRTRIEKKFFTSVELSIRYCFKVAVYAEFRRDWVEAMRFYEEAYRALREVVGTSTRLPPVQSLVEIRAVAEQLHFKISTLLLHGGKVMEAVTWFNKHIKSYRRLVGAPEIAFLHWYWFSRQFLVFAQLLETSLAPVPSNLSSSFGKPENPLTEWEFRPAYYYQLAASYLRDKRFTLEISLSVSGPELVGMVGSIPESVMPSVFVGQSARLFEQGDTIEVLPLSDAEFISYSIAEAQRFQYSYEIIALFKKAYESFNSLKATRFASYCNVRMAKEYFLAEDFSNAEQIFNIVVGAYRQEGWVTILWECLGYLRECSRKLGSAKRYVEYSLEMASLPVFSNGGIGTHNVEMKYGPAGVLSLSRREAIQKEAFEFLKGEMPVQSDGDLSIFVKEDEPICLDVDLVSPLRMVLLTSVAFHEQSVKPGSATTITLSLVSQLPQPLEVDHLIVEFNQPKCNFTISNVIKDLPEGESDMNNRDVRVESARLALVTKKWLRLSYEVTPGESGKLECLSVKAKMGKYFVICCRAESPASMEDLPLWRFENQVGSFPTKDPGLAFSGQKVIQVEELEPQVDLILDASGPALVGEKFVVPVTVVCKGHAVHSGELKINIVDAREGGMLMSPRDAETFSSDDLHVELLGISGSANEDLSPDEADSIWKIQHSFGLVSVPILEVGNLWPCKLEIKWHRPKTIMLYVSLGYSNLKESSSQRVNVSCSLQIEGKVPLIISHHYMMPYRREPLLLSRVKSLPGSNQEISVALHETSILVVSARNCSDAPLRIMSMSLRSSAIDSNTTHCSVQQIGGMASDAVLIPGGEFKGVFSITPKVESSDLEVGSVCLNLKRDSECGDLQAFVTEQNLPSVNAEKPALVVSLECPPHAVLGIPFSFYIRIENLTNLLQEIKCSLGDSQTYVFSGSHDYSAFILPKTDHIISYKVVPLSSGLQHLPRITLTSVKYAAVLNSSVAASTIFIFPSEPEFKVGVQKEPT